MEPLTFDNEASRVDRAIATLQGVLAGVLISAAFGQITPEVAEMSFSIFDIAAKGILTESEYSEFSNQAVSLLNDLSQKLVSYKN